MESISRKKMCFLSFNKIIFDFEVTAYRKYAMHMHTSKFTLNFKINFRQTHPHSCGFLLHQFHHDKHFKWKCSNPWYHITEIWLSWISHWCHFVYCYGIPISCYLISCMCASQRILTALFRLVLECTCTTTNTVCKVGNTKLNSHACAKWSYNIIR